MSIIRGVENEKFHRRRSGLKYGCRYTLIPKTAFWEKTFGITTINLIIKWQDPPPTSNGKKVLLNTVIEKYGYSNSEINENNMPMLLKVLN